MSCSRSSSESSDDAAKTETSTPVVDDLSLPSNVMSLTRADGEKVEVSVDEAANELVMPATTQSQNAAVKENAFYFYQGI